MSSYFLETSGLVKRYKQEPGSEYLDRLFESGATLYYLDLAVLEVRKVFYRLYKHPLTQDLQKGETLTEQEFHNAEAQFAADLLRIRRVSFDEKVLQKASIILEQHWLQSVFDLAQAAAFLLVRDWDPGAVFVCSDERSGLSDVIRQLCGTECVIIAETQT